MTSSSWFNPPMSVNSRPFLNELWIFDYRLGHGQSNFGQIRPIDISTHRWKFLSVVRLGQKIPKFCILGLASIIVTVTNCNACKKMLGLPSSKNKNVFCMTCGDSFCTFWQIDQNWLFATWPVGKAPQKRFEILPLLVTVTANGKLIALNYNNGLKLKLWI